MKQRAVLLSPQTVVVIPTEALTNSVIVQAQGDCMIRLDAASEAVYGFKLDPDRIYCIRTPFSVWANSSSPQNPSRLIIYPSTMNLGETPIKIL